MTLTKQPQPKSWKPQPNSIMEDAAPAFGGGGSFDDAGSFGIENPQDASPARSVSHARGARSVASALDKASEDLLRRVPPHSTEAEQAVLGGVFLKANLLNTLVDTIKAEDFYFPAHQILFEAFLTLYRKNAPIDLASVGQYLHSQSQLEAIGGAVYLAELANAVVSASNAEYFANIVRDKSLQRSLIDACSSIISNCYDPSREVANLLDESESAVFAISERTSGKVFRSAKDLIDSVFDELERRVENQGLVTGVTTGYTRLDQMTSGFQGSDLIIVAARPSMGKTAFALNMAMRAAVTQQVPVAVFSLEMSMEQLMMRMLCSYGKVDLSHLRKGTLDDEDWKRLYEAADVLQRAPIFIDDTPALTTLELRARTRRLRAEHGVGLVMVDYLQLMRSSRRTDSRELEISDISRSLKALAKELNIPVIALSQLNRKVEERTNKRPMLSDLRESGAIEQDADIIMFIYRDEAYNKRDDNPRKGIAEIIIGKQRNGPVGTAELAYLAAHTAFEDLDPSWTPPPSEDIEM